VIARSDTERKPIPAEVPETLRMTQAWGKYLDSIKTVRNYENQLKSIENSLQNLLNQAEQKGDQYYLPPNLYQQYQDLRSKYETLYNQYKQKYRVYKSNLEIVNKYIQTRLQQEIAARKKAQKQAIQSLITHGIESEVEPEFIQDLLSRGLITVEKKGERVSVSLTPGGLVKVTPEELAKLRSLGISLRQPTAGEKELNRFLRSLQSRGVISVQRKGNEVLISLTPEGIAKARPDDIARLRRLGLNIPENYYQALSDLYRRNIIKISDGKVIVNKSLFSLSRDDIKKLRNLGFTFSSSLLDAIDYAKREKLVKVEGNNLVLAKPIDALSDTDIKYLRTLGMNVPSLPKGLSRQFYEMITGPIDRQLELLGMVPSGWVKGLIDRFEAEKKQVGVSSALLGDFIEGFVSIVTEPYRLIVSLIPGEQPFEKGWRNITTRNLKYIDDYTPEQLRALNITGLAVTGLGAYLSGIPIGMSAKAIKNIVQTYAPLYGITTPTKIRRLTNFLIRHPKAVQATILAPAAGLEVGNVLRQLYMGVNPEDILFDEARRLVKITGQMAGLKKGWNLTRDKWAQINRYLDIQVKQTKYGPVVTLTKKTKRIPKWLADLLKEEVDPVTGEIILVGKGTKGAFTQYMALKGGKWLQQLAQEGKISPSLLDRLKIMFTGKKPSKAMIESALVDYIGKKGLQKLRRFGVNYTRLSPEEIASWAAFVKYGPNIPLDKVDDFGALILDLERAKQLEAFKSGSIQKALADYGLSKKQINLLETLLGARVEKIDPKIVAETLYKELGYGTPWEELLTNATYRFTEAPEQFEIIGALVPRKGETIGHVIKRFNDFITHLTSKYGMTTEQAMQFAGQVGTLTPLQIVETGSKLGLKGRVLSDFLATSLALQKDNQIEKFNKTLEQYNLKAKDLKLTIKTLQNMDNANIVLNNLKKLDEELIKAITPLIPKETLVEVLKKTDPSTLNKIITKIKSEDLKLSVDAMKPAELAKLLLNADKNTLTRIINSAGVTKLHEAMKKLDPEMLAKLIEKLNKADPSFVKRIKPFFYEKTRPLDRLDDLAEILMKEGFTAEQATKYASELATENLNSVIRKAVKEGLDAEKILALTVVGTEYDLSSLKGVKEVLSAKLSARQKKNILSVLASGNTERFLQVLSKLSPDLSAKLIKELVPSTFITQYLSKLDTKTFLNLAKYFKPTTIVNALKKMEDDELIAILLKLEEELASKTISSLDKEKLKTLAKKFKAKNVLKWLPSLYDSDLAFIIQHMPVSESVKIVSKLDKQKLKPLIRNLPSKYFEKIIPHLQERQVVEIIQAKNVTQETKQNIINKLKPEQLVEIIQKEDPDVIPIVVHHLGTDQLIKVIQESDAKTLEKLVYYLTPKQIDEIPHWKPFLPKPKWELVRSILIKRKGLPEKPTVFKVVFRFTVGGKTFKVRAKDFPEALRHAWSLKKTKIIPRMVTVERIE